MASYFPKTTFYYFSLDKEPLGPTAKKNFLVSLVLKLYFLAFLNALESIVSFYFCKIIKTFFTNSILVIEFWPIFLYQKSDQKINKKWNFVKTKTLTLLFFWAQSV